MHSVHEWNIHHRSKHSKIVLRCKDCGKRFHILSSLRDHRHLHKGQPFVCNTYEAKFTFYSRLQLLRNLHSSTQMHICFSDGCDKKYHWPQDLLWHLNKHCKCFFGCELCAYKIVTGCKIVYSWISCHGAKISYCTKSDDVITGSDDITT